MTDPDGLVLKFQGDDLDVAKVELIIESLKKNEKARAFIEQAQNCKEEIVITVVRHSKDVFVGDFDQGTIDIGDIEALAMGSEVFTEDILVLHEIIEQFLTATTPRMSFEQAHARAVEVEVNILGWERVFAPQPIIAMDENGVRVVRRLLVIQKTVAPDEGKKKTIRIDQHSESGKFLTVKESG